MIATIEKLETETVVSVNKTFHYKLKPTKNQEIIFGQWLGTCRYLYNVSLEYRKYLYAQKGVNISKFDLINEIPEVKKTEGFEWIKQVPANTLQAVIERLDNSYQRFFKLGAGFPKFAQKNKYKSFLLKNNSSGSEIKVSGNRFKLPKIGHVKFFNSRPVESKIKTATIRKEADGWYISVTFVGNVEALPLLDNNVGLDLGVKYFAVTSDGEYIDNPRHYNKYQDELRILQRSLDRKKKGGNNRNKASIKLDKIHQKIANTRKDFLNKVSTKLISENQSVVVEDLRIKNLTKKSKPKLSDDGKTYLKNNRKQKAGLSKSILDAGWGMFCNMLDYKSKWFGRWFVKVPAQYTSRDCSNCNFRTEEMPLTIREWQCPQCNSFHNRDENASKNILKKWLEDQN
ncbi:MAG: transposase [Candidatus Sericytochromatia bacterium]|nr:transposase [Candidatus Sericytochromatia bacterium]